MLVSGNVHDHVAGRLSCRFELLGEQHYKNIDRPVRVYRVLSEETVAASTSTLPAPLAEADREHPLSSCCRSPT